MRKLIILGIVVFLFCGLLFSKLMYAEEKVKVAPVQGAVAPDFILSDLSGKKVELKEIYQKNNLTIVNFWATWCPPCRGEIPDFNRFYRDYRGKGLEIVGVNIQEESTLVGKFVKDQEIKFTILLDSKGDVARTYYINAIPTTFIIDRQGKILQIHRGMMVYSKLEAVIKKYLPADMEG